VKKYTSEAWESTGQYSVYSKGFGNDDDDDNQQQRHET